MDINSQDKLIILLEIRKERLDQAEKVRDRAFQVVTWVAGIFFLLTGYLTQEKLTVSLLQKFVLILSVILALGIIIVYINELENGFKTQLRILAKVETMLGLYQSGFFCQDESLFPERWAQNPGSGKFFSFIKSSLALVSVFVLAAISLKGVLF